MAQNKKKESKEEKYISISLILFAVALIQEFISLIGWYSFRFVPPGIVATLSLIFIIEFIKRSKARKAEVITIIVLDVIMLSLAFINVFDYIF